MAPVPDHATTLKGGCSCGAIRYKLEIPDKSSRGIFSKAEDTCRPDEGDVLYPLMVMCHCNDCRHITGGVVNPGAMAPIEWSSYSLLLKEDGKTRRDVTGWEAVLPNEKSEGTFMSYYQSPHQEQVMRSFCGRCGTPSGYVRYPVPEGRVATVDLYLGTLDREDLQNTTVDRHVWWDYGIGWAQRIVANGDASLVGQNIQKPSKKGLPKHSLNSLKADADYFVDE